MLGDIRNAHGERIDYTFHPGAPNARGVVVIGHGVTANKDRPALRQLADGLGVLGIPALRFSFSGNGDSEGAFVDSTIRKEVEDLGAVLDALAGKQVAYVGHSMGAAVGVLRATTDRRIRLLVSLAGMARTREFAARHFGEIVPGGGFMWGKPECPLSAAFMDDMNAIGTLVGHADDVKVPWLFVHGDADTVVPLADTELMYEAANEPKERVVIAGADHLFQGDAIVPMVKRVCAWLGDRLF